MRALVVTVSDRVSRGEATDRSGPEVAQRLESLGFTTELLVVPDGVSSVRSALEAAVADGFDVVVTTGGTGFSPRDLTPEATHEVVERPAPGIAEAIRAATFGVNPHGMLSRGVAGIAGSTLIINVPGSVAGAVESLDIVASALGHAVALLRDEPSGHTPNQVS